MSFTFSGTPLEGVIRIESDMFSDYRGYFIESYKESDFKRFDLESSFVQDNHSFSKTGVIRGLHYQKYPNEQGKLVSVISGKIYDVAVDIRPTSRTFGKWFAVVLSDLQGTMLWIPPGFAHGFQALQDSHVYYKVTSEFSRNDDTGIRWDDPDVGIDWPDGEHILSEKDTQLPLLRDLENLRGDPS